jgi:CDP-4-dehydro-6-deoxyglucose reductase, E1
MRVFYAQAVYGREEIDAVTRVLEDSSLALMGGPEVSRFEQRVAALFGKRFGLMVNSGSSANTLAFAALELERGSEVITPALTFSTTVAPLVQQGLVPAFVDVEPDTFNIDAAQVEDLIGPRTKAMMVPNLIGNLPDWGSLREIADRHGLKVVEDSADTIGSTYRGAPTGALSDIATTSFYASHVVTAAGFGGMVTLSDPELEQRARLLRGWGRSSSILGESEAIEDRFGVDLDGIEYDAKFLFSGIGYNFLPSEIAAAFGNVQLDRLSEYAGRRIANYAGLRTFFAKYEEWFILPRQNPDAVTPWLAVPLIVREDAPFTRRELQTHLETAGIQTRVVFTGNVLRQPAFAGIERREHPGGYPNADRVTSGGLLLGCHQGMTREQIDHVMDTFGEFAAAR